jgi:hypothetical protein
MFFLQSKGFWFVDVGPPDFIPNRLNRSELQFPAGRGHPPLTGYGVPHGLWFIRLITEDAQFVDAQGMAISQDLHQQVDELPVDLL